MSEKTPKARVYEALRRINIAGLVAGKSVPLTFESGDVVLLDEIASDVEQMMKRSGADYVDLSSLCYRIGQYHGQPGHDWGDWREPYEAGGGEWWHSRTCQRCHEHQFERCEAPTVQDDARE